MSSDGNLAQDADEQQGGIEFEENRCPSCGRRVWIRKGRELHPCSRCSSNQPAYSWLRRSGTAANNTDKERSTMTAQTGARAKASEKTEAQTQTTDKAFDNGKGGKTTLINYHSPETFSDEARQLFASKIRKGEPNECWPWAAKGLEFIYMNRGFNIPKYAYLAAHPEADRDARYKTTCGTRLCGNPAHVVPSVRGSAPKAMTAVQTVEQTAASDMAQASADEAPEAKSPAKGKARSRRRSEKARAPRKRNASPRAKK